MPIYEYICKDCGKEFEVLQKITAEPITKCKFCGGKVEKLVSNSSFTFKGGGWYITDYSNKKGKKQSNKTKTTTTTANTANNNNSPKTKETIKSDSKPVKNKKEHKKVS